MKKILLLIGLSFIGLVQANAQYAVSDSGLYGILNAQQQQILQQWSTSIQNFQNQLSTAEQQLNSLTNLQNAIGNPAAISGNINMGQLTSQLTNNPLTQNLQQLVAIGNQVQGIASNPMSLFPTISNITGSGTTVTRDNTQYTPYNALDSVYTASVNATQSLQQQEQAVQSDIATTEQQLQTAPDQATVQKLQGKLQGDQAELANLQQQVSQANQQVLTQAAVNQSHAQEQQQANTEAAGQDISQALTNLKQTSENDQLKFLNQ